MVINLDVKAAKLYTSETTILFGACSSKHLGNVTVKTPFSIFALICSSCVTIQVSVHSLPQV